MAQRVRRSAPKARPVVEVRGQTCVVRFPGWLKILLLLGIFAGAANAWVVREDLVLAKQVALDRVLWLEGQFNYRGEALEDARRELKDARGALDVCLSELGASRASAAARWRPL